jgi:acyl-homoserine lactone acylase PvdQ
VQLPQGVGIQEMNAGDQPVIGVADTVQQPGTYTLQVSSMKFATLVCGLLHASGGASNSAPSQLGLVIHQQKAI